MVSTAETRSSMVARRQKLTSARIASSGVVHAQTLST
jgi:hypothetical protein